MSPVPASPSLEALEASPTAATERITAVLLAAQDGGAETATAVVVLDSDSAAALLDEAHPAPKRDAFHIPKAAPYASAAGGAAATLAPELRGDESVYMCGNSLGCAAKGAIEALREGFEDWATLGVAGHFGGRHPFALADAPAVPVLEQLVGAVPGGNEVASANQLSCNLHLLLSALYRPQGARCKILLEDQAFPSDMYAAQSQVRARGLDPSEHVRTVTAPAFKGGAAGEISDATASFTLTTEQIVTQIQELGSELAVLFFAGVQYFTGQAFDMKAITDAAHSVGAVVLLDLAHAIGNVKLQLHDWGVDAAVWCGYKYLNGGAGTVGGFFVHQKFSEQYGGTVASMPPRLEGWWGNAVDTRFNMAPVLDPALGANAFRLSNPSMMHGIVMAHSLALFKEVGLDALRARSLILTQYLRSLLEQLLADVLVARPTGGLTAARIVTPADATAHGAQLSLYIGGNARELYVQLKQSGVALDYRNPGVLRVAPTPMYNTFADCLVFTRILRRLLLAQQQ